MKIYPNKIKNEAQLEDLLSLPTSELVESMKKLKGDILILGVGGKIGPSLAKMAKRACEQAGIEKRVVGVSLFESDARRENLEQAGIETIHGDLLDRQFLDSLPQIKNVIFMAGMKFGSTENQAMTWAINSYLPALIADRFTKSRIVVFSTGCVYPLVPVSGGGCTEQDPLDPIGEYAQSCLGRERMFEYGSKKYGTPVLIVRLNYAVEMRYGVLVDIALKVFNKSPVDLTIGYANMMWQGDVNEVILRLFDYCGSPAEILNLTGPETVSLRWVAKRFGELFQTEPQFVGEESETAFLSNASRAHRLFGYPKVTLDQMIIWIASWIEQGQPLLNKPTHYEVRNGKF
ncbi:epimerase [candidate division KSB1 bacterium 4484_87]|nr:MAG: epimerase [candidate division KSB1 bacterium 4484_87]